MAGNIERYAEEFVRKEMKIKLGRNSFGNVYVQGENRNYVLWQIFQQREIQKRSDA